MFEASVIASDIKDEEKIVDLDEIMNKSPLVDASPLSCMSQIDGGEALLLETSSPENSPLKFRFESLKFDWLLTKLLILKAGSEQKVSLLCTCSIFLSLTFVKIKNSFCF